MAEDATKRRVAIINSLSDDVPNHSMDHSER